MIIELYDDIFIDFVHGSYGSVYCKFNLMRLRSFDRFVS